MSTWPKTPDDCPGYEEYWGRSTPTCKHCGVPFADHRLVTQADYWKHLPAGHGKLNSEDLLKLSNPELSSVWLRANELRQEAYPEEAQFVRNRLKIYSGQRIFSVGSGLGFHELAYAHYGALVTCFDIVESNLTVLNRLARLDKDIKFFRTLDTFTDLNLAEKHEVFYFWGSLQHMRTDMQLAWLQYVRFMLAPHGELVIMSYTWDYVHLLCPEMTKESFDPVAFGRLSDPEAEGLVCPYADWHNVDRLVRLGTYPFRLIEERKFNNDLFAWYVFEKIR